MKDWKTLDTAKLQQKLEKQRTEATVSASAGGYAKPFGAPGAKLPKPKLPYSEVKPK